MPDDFQCIDDALDGYAEVDARMSDALTVSRDAICLQRYVSYLFRRHDVPRGTSTATVH